MSLASVLKEHRKHDMIRFIKKKIINAVDKATQISDRTLIMF
jgi:hypothetical protein